MAIGEAAAKAGLCASTLRYYESVGVLPKPLRVSGQRRYGPELLEWLAWIKVAQRAGFSIEEMKQLFHGFPRSRRPSERWRKLAEKKLPEVEALIRKFTTMKRLLEEGIRCRCSSLDDCTLTAL